MLPLLLALGACGGSPSPCVSKDVQVTHEPGGDRYAASEKRYCAGGSDPVAIVRVGRSSHPREEVEVFVARARPAALVSPTWIGRGRLEIAHTEEVTMLKSAGSAEGATISYRVTERYQPPGVP